MREFVIFLRNNTMQGALVSELKKHTLMLHQKCAYQMKVNFFPAVIGEIDDDDNKKGKGKIRDYKLRCNMSFHSITLHLKRDSRERC